MKILTERVKELIDTHENLSNISLDLRKEISAETLEEVEKLVCEHTLLQLISNGKDIIKRIIFLALFVKLEKYTNEEGELDYPPEVKEELGSLPDSLLADFNLFLKEGVQIETVKHY